MESLGLPRLRLVPLSLPELLQFHLDCKSGENLRIPEGAREEGLAALEWAINHCKWIPEEIAWHTAWVLQRVSDDLHVGVFQFSGPPDHNGLTVIAYWLDDRFQRQGYMTEALGAMCRWAFNDHRTLGIVASAAASNTPSQRVLERNLFVRDGDWRGNPQWVLRRNQLP